MGIDRASVPEWLHFWELADGDCDGIPCRYKPGILVNSFGTFLTAGELPVDCKEAMEGFIGSDEDWDFTGERYVSFEEVIWKEQERMPGSQKRYGSCSGKEKCGIPDQKQDSLVCRCSGNKRMITKYQGVISVMARQGIH